MGKGKNPHLNNIPDFIIKWCIARPDSRCSQDFEYSTWLLKKIALRFIGHIFVVGDYPPSPTSIPHLGHMISVHRSPLFFCRSSAYVHWTEHKPRNKSRGSLRMRLTLGHICIIPQCLCIFAV